MNLDNILKYLGITVFCGMAFAILAVAISEIHSFDVFWQLQNGRYMTDTLSMIRVDTFTLAADAPRFEHTWLHSLILYGLYKFFGYGMISVLKGVLITLTAIFLAMAARERQASWLSICVVLPAYLLTAGGWLERPQLWSFLGAAMFIWWLEKYVKAPSWRILWLLPVMLLWSNLHAGSILALALLFAYLVGDTGQSLIEKRFTWRHAGQLAASMLGLLLAGLANPYPERWLNTLLSSSKLGASLDEAGQATGPKTAVFNMDWTPTTFQNEPLFFYAMGVVAVIMLLGFRRLKLSDVCLLAGLAFMGTKLVRHIPFFYIGAVAILPAYLDQAVQPIQSRLPQLYQRVAQVGVACLALGCFWYYWSPIQGVYGTFKTGLREWHYPIQATEFVQEHQLPKNIYNTYDWGGYMAFKLFPEYLMFWDGRQNSAEMFSHGWNVMAGKPNWQEILDRFNVNTIVTRASTIDIGMKYPLLDRLKESVDWSLVFNTESSLIFVKNGAMPEHWIKRFAKPKERIDDTVLAEANLMVQFNANRYMAWLEMARIYEKRGFFNRALFAVNQHIARAPRPHPEALRMQQALSQHMRGRLQ